MSEAVDPCRAAYLEWQARPGWSLYPRELAAWNAAWHARDAEIARLERELTVARECHAKKVRALAGEREQALEGREK